MFRKNKEDLSKRNLKKIIERKEKEIIDVKESLVDILLKIRDINEWNNYNNESIKRRKISELCNDTAYELLEDIKEDTSPNQKIKLVSSK